MCRTELLAGDTWHQPSHFTEVTKPDSICDHVSAGKTRACAVAVPRSPGVL